MTPHQVFLYRLRQLTRIVDSRDMNALLDLSLILRQFLVDGATVVDAVNRHHRLKIRFTTGLPMEDSLAELEGRGIPRPAMMMEGNLAGRQRTQELSRDGFLRHSVLYSMGSMSASAK